MINTQKDIQCVSRTRGQLDALTACGVQSCSHQFADALISAVIPENVLFNISAKPQLGNSMLLILMRHF